MAWLIRLFDIQDKLGLLGDDHQDILFFREAVELLGQYQRQVSGFLMAAVSQLCFAGSQPPETAAVKHLFGYIIHR